MASGFMGDTKPQFLPSELLAFAFVSGFRVDGHHRNHSTIGFRYHVLRTRAIRPIASQVGLLVQGFTGQCSVIIRTALTGTSIP